MQRFSYSLHLHTRSQRMPTHFVLHKMMPARVLKSTESGTVAFDRGQTSHMQCDIKDALPLKSMPGPRGLRTLPYIGTMLLFKPFTDFTPETFGKLMSSLHDKYGPIFRFRLGKDYGVQTESAADAETIFRTENAYPLRNTMMLSKVYRERNGLPRALGTVSGPEWHQLRSPLNPLLNKPQMCLHYLPAQNQVADDFVDRLETMTFSLSELSEEFFRFATESIGVVCFNQRLGFLNIDNDGAQEKDELLTAFKKALSCTYLSIIGVERKYLRSDKDPFYIEYSDAMNLIRKHSMTYVRKVKDELEARQNNEFKQAESSADSSRYDQESNLLASLIVNSKLEMEEILAIIDSLLIAGSDSSARNLAVLFYNFAKNPEKQQKAAQEVFDVMGRRGAVTAQALSSMNYLKSCVKESMRLNFPLANGTQRILSADTVLSGYLVPKGTSVTMSSNRSSLDPLNFSDPFSFSPERWIRESRDGLTPHKKPPAFAYLPFGHGARGCIGRRFAEMELYVGAAKLLQRLHVDVDPSYSGLDCIHTPFITPKTPIPFVFTPRTW